MTELFLASQCLIYCALGVWCLLKPTATAKSVGFLDLSTQGVAEFAAVYGGLEFALGLFFGICYVDSSLRSAGILFACLLYSGLVLFRTVALFRYGSSIGKGWYFYYFEIAMLLICSVLLALDLAT